MLTCGSAHSLGSAPNSPSHSAPAICHPWFCTMSRIQLQQVRSTTSPRQPVIRSGGGAEPSNSTGGLTIF